MNRTEANKLAELFKKIIGRPHRVDTELKALLKAINEYNQWKTQITQSTAKTLF